MALQPRPLEFVGEPVVSAGSPAPRPVAIAGLDAAVVGSLESVAGYDAGETQTLKNVAGVLTWVTDGTP